jgi:hypothetical protein
MGRTEMSTKNAVLVAGVHGVSGRAAAEHWASLPGTQVYGLSRRSAPLPASVQSISADLLDREDLRRKLGEVGGITHIVFGAYLEKPNLAERSEANVAILNWRSSGSMTCSQSPTSRSRRGPSPTPFSVSWSMTTSRAPSRRAELGSTTASIQRRCSSVSSPTSAKTELFHKEAASLGICSGIGELMSGPLDSSCYRHSCTSRM